MWGGWYREGRSAAMTGGNTTARDACEHVDSAASHVYDRASDIGTRRLYRSARRAQAAAATTPAKTRDAGPGPTPLPVRGPGDQSTLAHLSTPPTSFNLGYYDLAPTPNAALRATCTAPDSTTRGHDHTPGSHSVAAPVARTSNTHRRLVLREDALTTCLPPFRALSSARPRNLAARATASSDTPTRHPSYTAPSAPALLPSACDSGGTTSTSLCRE